MQSQGCKVILPNLKILFLHSKVRITIKAEVKVLDAEDAIRFKGELAAHKYPQVSKAQTKPKPPMSAWRIFIAEKMQRKEKEHPHLAVVARLKLQVRKASRPIAISN